MIIGLKHIRHVFVCCVKYNSTLVNHFRRTEFVSELELLEQKMYIEEKGTPPAFYLMVLVGPGQRARTPNIKANRALLLMSNIPVDLSVRLILTSCSAMKKFLITLDSSSFPELARDGRTKNRYKTNEILGII